MRVISKDQRAVALSPYAPPPAVGRKGGGVMPRRHRDSVDVAMDLLKGKLSRAVAWIVPNFAACALARV
jgi:hypothetical protein